MELQQKIERELKSPAGARSQWWPNEGGSYVRDRYSGSFVPPACGAPVGLPTTPQVLSNAKFGGALQEDEYLQRSVSCKTWA